MSEFRERCDILSGRWIPLSGGAEPQKGWKPWPISGSGCGFSWLTGRHPYRSVFLREADRRKQTDVNRTAPALPCGQPARPEQLPFSADKSPVGLSAGLFIHFGQFCKYADSIVLPPRCLWLFSQYGLHVTLTVQWAEDNDMTLKFIKPDKATQNEFIERFNRAY